MSLDEVFKVIQDAPGGLVAALLLLVALVTGQSGLWVFGSQYKELKRDNDNLKDQIIKLTAERDEARYLAITSAGMAGRLSEEAKKLQ